MRAFLHFFIFLILLSILPGCGGGTGGSHIRTKSLSGEAVLINGMPLTNATVSVQGIKTTTDQSGVFAILDLPLGEDNSEVLLLTLENGQTFETVFTNTSVQTQQLTLILDPQSGILVAVDESQNVPLGDPLMKDKHNGDTKNGTIDNNSKGKKSINDGGGAIQTLPPEDDTPTETGAPRTESLPDETYTFTDEGNGTYGQSGTIHLNDAKKHVDKVTINEIDLTEPHNFGKDRIGNAGEDFSAEKDSSEIDGSPSDSVLPEKSDPTASDDNNYLSGSISPGING